jgi:hypothetical protein
MNDAAANTPAPERAGPKPDGESWSQKKWLVVVAIIFAAHVAIIFALGEKKQVVPRAVTNVPRLKLADNSGEMLALDDPTLFALPHLEGFAGPALRDQPRVLFHRLDWTEDPRWLSLSAENLGATFSRFMQTNYFGGYTNDFKPPPKLSAPPPVETVFAQNSTLQIVGGLAHRRLLDKINLPSLQYNDVIAPSVVQALVDATGNVVSAVLLPSENSMEVAGRTAIGDTTALQIALKLRFAPSSQRTLGRLIFNWRTVPLPATNAPAASP